MKRASIVAAVAVLAVAGLSMMECARPYFRKYCTVETTRTIFWSCPLSFTPGA
jgi:hypothetical protein